MIERLYHEIIYRQPQCDPHYIVQVDKKQHLHKGAMTTFEECFQSGIKLEIEWIPRPQDQIADYIMQQNPRYR